MAASTDPILEHISESAAGLGRTLAAYGDAVQRAMADFAEKWPAERIVASAIEDLNKRMDEFNGKTG